MTLIDLAVAMMIVVVVVFGSLFFSEWAEMHSDSYVIEIFAKFGMPAVLWAVVLLVIDILEKNGVI